MVTLEEVKSLKVAELKEELKALGLSTEGLKPALVTRLEDALKSGGVNKSSDVAQTAAATADIAPPSTETTSAAAAPQATTNGRVAISFTGNANEAAKVVTGTQSTAVKSDGPDSKPTPIEATVLSEEEKRKQRADRFGLPPSLDEKKAERAARFGLQQPAETKATASGAEGIAPITQADKAALEEKKKERAKRFNLTTTLSKEEIEKQKKARLDRFGSSTNGTASKEGISTVKGDDSADIQAKLAARAQRFALSGNAGQTPKATEAVKVEEPKKPLDPEAEAKRKAREIKFVSK